MLPTRPLGPLATRCCLLRTLPTRLPAVQHGFRRRQRPLNKLLNSHRRTLVTRISPTLTLLRADDRDNEVYLVGTAHVSEASAREVSELIETSVQPQTVFIELDPVRAARLRQQNQPDELEQEEELFRTASASLSGMKFPPQLKSTLSFEGKMLETYLRRFYGMLKRYGLVPGIDMWTAMQAGQRVGATIYYGDRDSQETFRDLAATFQMSHLAKAFTTPVPDELRRVVEDCMANSDVAQKVEAIKSREYARQMTAWMDQALPATADVLVHQRDIIMARNLRQHCNRGRVVAVVGIAHMEGIEHEWSLLERKEQ